MPFENQKFRVDDVEYMFINSTLLQKSYFLAKVLISKGLSLNILPARSYIQRFF